MQNTVELLDFCILSLKVFTEHCSVMGVLGDVFLGEFYFDFLKTKFSTFYGHSIPADAAGYWRPFDIRTDRKELRSAQNLFQAP